MTKSVLRGGDPSDIFVVVNGVLVPVDGFENSGLTPSDPGGGGDGGGGDPDPDPSPTYIPIGARNGAGQSNTASGSKMSRLALPMPYAATSIKVRFTNRINGTDNTVPITVKCSYEHGGTFTAGVDDASHTTMTLGPGAQGTMTIAATHPGGTNPTTVDAWLRVYATGDIIPSFFVAKDSVAGETGYDGGTDMTAGGSIPFGKQGFGPDMVLITTPDTTRVWGGLGDSETAGLNGTPNDSGWFGIAHWGHRGYIKYALSGRTSAAVKLKADQWAPMLASCTDVTVLLGTNDIDGGGGVASIAKNLLAIATILVANGTNVWHLTLPPRTTSSDLWRTLEGQTPDPGYESTDDSVRTVLNEWIRAGLPTLDGINYSPVGTPGAMVAGDAGHPSHDYIEFADTVESGRNSGLWKVDGTSKKWTLDGVHPSPYGYTQIAALLFDSSGNPL